MYDLYLGLGYSKERLISMHANACARREAAFHKWEEFTDVGGSLADQESIASGQSILRTFTAEEMHKRRVLFDKFVRFRNKAHDIAKAIEELNRRERESHECNERWSKEGV